jgi:hypothetical protein
MSYDDSLLLVTVVVRRTFSKDEIGNYEPELVVVLMLDEIIDNS